MNALLLLALASVAPASVATTSPNLNQERSLRVQALRIGLNLGTCIKPALLRDNADDGQYGATAAANFTMVEPENDLKPPALWMGLGKYNFENADYLIGAPGKKGWAEEHHLKVRGHVLVYARDDGYTIPGWLLKMEPEITKDQAKEILRTYIHTVAGRYKGKIAFWDVINEAIDDKPTANPFNLRNSFWFRKLGPEFLLLAFQYAHEADPKAELYYNEYAVEGGGKKAESMLELAEYLKKNHAPITGLGLQYHTWLENKIEPGDGHYGLLKKIQSKGLAFMVTELDLGIAVEDKPRNDPQHGEIPKSAADLQTQADRYGNIFKMALSFPNCHGVQLWGFTDRYSWIPDYQPGKGAALIFDPNYHRKLAFDSIYSVLKGR